MSRPEQNLSSEDLRKVHKHLFKSDKGAIMEDGELIAALGRFGPSTVQSAIHSVGANGKSLGESLTKDATVEAAEEAEQLPDNVIVHLGKIGERGFVAEQVGGPSAETRELRKFVKAEVDAVKNKLNGVNIGASRALTQTLQMRREYDEIRQEIRDSTANQGKMLATRLDQISNTVAAYMSSGPEGSKAEPLQVVINIPEKHQVVLEGQHTRYEFEKCLRLLGAGLNLNLVGPKGSGKSTLVRQLAQALNLPFYRGDSSGDTARSELLIRMVFTKGGQMTPLAGPFLCGYASMENVLDVDGVPVPRLVNNRAGLVCIEEADAMDPSVAVALNGALGNIGGGNTISIPELAMVGLPMSLEQAGDFLAALCCNTFGTGMDLQYAGRQAQDAAFLDRFYTVYIEYDSVLEAKIGNLPMPLENAVWSADQPPSLEEWQDLARWVISIRQLFDEMGVRRDWGTRSLLKAKAARYAGIPTEEIKSDLLLGLPKDLREKALIYKPKAKVGLGGVLSAHLGAMA